VFRRDPAHFPAASVQAVTRLTLPFHDLCASCVRLSGAASHALLSGECTVEPLVEASVLPVAARVMLSTIIC
jgi:hypothetical protein